ncbi:MAG: PepSY-like domain-containing protein [Prevotella sp.]|nr:PepSY-like domain-containing protein [Prevotella sp.]MDO4980511.1 hypothetical protein [Prevotellaceae bacterium]
MKAIKLIVISLVCMFAFASCDQDKIITADQLPAAAQSYVQKTYPGVGITYAKQDKELFSTKYNVRLDNGLEIEFDGDGVPVDIDTDN